MNSHPLIFSCRMAKVDIISSCLVPMALATNSVAISRMELTPWDLQIVQLDPIQKGILFYKPNQTQEFQKTFIDHLKTSLSHTLDFFPPLAGRLGTIEDGDNKICFFINCNNAGAEFTYAVAGAVSVSDILDPKYIPDIVYSFFPLNGVPNFEGISKPLLGVQVTELADGFFIGFTANHCIVDGTSFWHFINSWAEISRGLDTISKPPIFQRWFPGNIFSDNKLIYLPRFDQNPLPNSSSPPLFQRFFHFSRGSVAKLKAKAHSEARTDRISSLQAVSAHLWRSVVRNRHQQNTERVNSQEVSFGSVVGARARIPLPGAYFGNAVSVANTASSEDEILQNGLGYAALKINELVAQQTTESAIKFVEDWVKNPVLLKRLDSTSGFLISSSPRHDVYGCDFGWGKPVAVRSGKGQKFDGKMTVFPAAEPGGIDVEACLAPETLRALDDDAEFMEAFAI